ncbi:MAG: TolC family protein [bacterium]|nr:TolC family protein [bacterium]
MNLVSSISPRTGRVSLNPALAILIGLLATLPHPPVAGAVQENAGGASGPLPLSLAEARNLALANDEQIQQMTEAVFAAGAEAAGARADRLPRLDLGATWNRSLKKPVMFLPATMAASFGGTTSLEMGGDYELQSALTMTVNLWTAGRLSAAAGAADAALAATRWQKAVVQDAVLYTVESAYFDVLLAQASVAIAEAAVEAASEALRVTDAAYAEGTTSRFDRLRAEVELANRQAPLIQARNLRDLATLQLRRTCGLAPDSELVLTDGLEAVDGPTALEILLADMKIRSPELASLRHQVAARNQAVRLAKAGRGPVLQMKGQYAVQGQWDDDFLPGDDETAGSATAGLALSWPIFDGFAAKADMGRTGADLRSAQVELERVTKDRELGVRQTRVHLLNALAALEGRRESVTLAEEAHRLALVRLENGLATPLERLDAELALTDARTQLAEVLHNCNIARSALTLAVGTHTAPDTGSQEVQR